MLDHSYDGKYWGLVAWGWECSIFIASPSACYSAFNPSAVLLPVDDLSCILNVPPLSVPRVGGGDWWCRVMLYLHVAFQRRNRLTVRLIYQCITVKLDGVICVRCMSNVGLDRAFSGSHTELSARQ